MLEYRVFELCREELSGTLTTKRLIESDGCDNYLDLDLGRHFETHMDVTPSCTFEIYAILCVTYSSIKLEKIIKKVPRVFQLLVDHILTPTPKI